jgi:hypothetical protein
MDNVLARMKRKVKKKITGILQTTLKVHAHTAYLSLCRQSQEEAASKGTGQKCMLSHKVFDL